MKSRDGFEEVNRELREGAPHLRVLPVPLEVHVEEVLPHLRLGGAGLDLRQVDPPFRKGLQHPVEGADPVLDGEEDGGFVVPRPGTGARQRRLPGSP